MRAARIDRFGGPETMDLVDVDVPAPGAGQVLVEVHASSLNPVDVAVRQGWLQQVMPLDLPVTLGTDVAGVVIAVGADVDSLAVGEAVFGAASPLMGGSGAFAEFAATPVGLLAPLPPGVDFVTAASLPLAGVSALQAVADSLGLSAGQTVFIHGAAGGVGLLAVAIAKHAGARVVASARGVGLPAVAAAGADQVVDTASEEFTTVVSDVDAVLDLVGGTDTDRILAVVRPGGRVVSLLNEPDPALAAQRGVHTGLQYTQVTTDRLNTLASLVVGGTVTPHLHQVEALDQIGSAFAAMAAGGIVGKIGIRVR